VDRLDEKLQLLAGQPLLGRGRPELAAGLRSMPFGDVVRILHSARDVDAVFDEAGSSD
jgi:plasmid stabilization system protein ParE